MKIGIIREGKLPQDKRVPLPPNHCRKILDNYAGIEIVVQPSDIRCFSDDEYLKAGITLSNKVGDCDVLLGVKEVPIKQLIPDKMYFFFSHTIKEQPYNQDLLRAVIRKNIHLVDYEVLTGEAGNRLIAFGRFAGMVGAHNALWTYGQRSNLFTLPRLYECKDYEDAKVFYHNVHWPKIKIVLTGTGRVGRGAVEVLTEMKIKKVSPEDFLNKEFHTAIFTQLDGEDYAQRKDGKKFDRQDFFDHPEKYESKFLPFAEKADIFINGIYWDASAPQFFTKEEMKSDKFNISVIADITCDIAPEASVPSTLRPSTIEEPVYGYDPIKESETLPYQGDSIDVMAIDNLPNELPRDSSEAFGDQFYKHIMDELVNWKESKVIEGATIAKDGKLGPHFQYLESYAGIKK